MNDYLVVGLAGFVASMVDGSLGMGFGPTSSSILLGSGLSPVSVSATVNVAKVMTGIVGGLSHWRFGNTDKRLVAQLALPGILGALTGATLLREISSSALEPLLATLLIIIAIRILFRFRKADSGRPSARSPSNMKGVAGAGFAGGVTNGLVGAWGPVVTPVLIHKGFQTRFAVGSVNAAEVAVAVVSVGSLAPSFRGDGLDAGILVAMVVGGVIAAPLAALLVRRLPRREMALAVACLLILTNIRILSNWAGVGSLRWGAYFIVLLAVSLMWLQGRGIDDRR